MLSKSTYSALVVVGLGVAGLGVAAWLKPSLAQVHQPSSKARPQAAAAAPGETEESRIQARNLKEILLASQNYAAPDNCFPPPAIYGDGNQPLLSWRVAILPNLGQNELYQQFHLNEAWDSPHNKALIDRMPAVFETPAAPAPKGQTRFRGIAGKGSVFDPDFNSNAGMMMGYGGMGSSMMGAMMGHGTAAMRKGVDQRNIDRARQQKETRLREMQARLAGEQTTDDPNTLQQPRGRSVEPEASDSGAAMESGMMDMMMMGMGPASSAVVRRGVNLVDITDGTANTVFAVVARDATPWTKPGELPFVPDQDLPALDEHDPRGYVLGMCHGNVRLLKKEDHQAPYPGQERLSGFQRILTALITRSGGEVVSSDVFADEPHPAVAAAHAPAHAPAAAPGSPSMEERMRMVEEKLDRLLEKLDAR